MNNKIKVSVLGKGEKEIQVEEKQTIKELRNLLALDADVKAVDQNGNELSDSTEISGDVQFFPDVQGGC